jgi:hypothetical protein
VIGPGPAAFHGREPGVPDLRLLFATRSLRLFASGFLSVVLVLHLAAAGPGPAETRGEVKGTL